MPPTTRSMTRQATSSDSRVSTSNTGSSPDTEVVSQQTAFPPSSPPASLLTLPPELRLKIYRLALASFHPDLRDSNTALELPPLLKTCKQIRTEAMQTYYVRLQDLFLAEKLFYVNMVNGIGDMTRARNNRHVIAAAGAEAYSRKGMVKEMYRDIEKQEERMEEAGYPVQTWKRMTREVQYKICRKELDSKEEVAAFLWERTVDALREW